MTMLLLGDDEFVVVMLRNIFIIYTISTILSTFPILLPQLPDDVMQVKLLLLRTQWLLLKCGKSLSDLDIKLGHQAIEDVFDSVSHGDEDGRRSSL